MSTTPLEWPLKADTVKQMLENLGADANAAEPTPPQMPVTNVNVEEYLDKDGKVKKRIVPKLINELSDETFRDYGQWPRNIGGCLFDFHAERKPSERVEKIERTADLFSWLQRRGNRAVHWYRCMGCATKDEYFSQIVRTAKRYEMISFAPHWPLRDDVFYHFSKLPPPDPAHASFERFVDFFNPCDAPHRTLMKAFFLTPLWYDRGHDAEFVKPPPRPGFLIDTVDAQASGKSTVVNMCAQLYATSCIRKSKETLRDETAVKKSILSEEGRRKRILLLDNVTGTLKSDFLADLMTTPEITGLAPYGHGDESRPNDLTFAVTANGAELDTDLATRFYTVRIHAPDPELLAKIPTGDGSVWESRLTSYIAENRLQLFADMIDLLERAPYRARRGSRFPAFDSRVLSAAALDDAEYAAAAQAIEEDASNVNVDKAAGENFTALVENTLTWLRDKNDPLYVEGRPTVVTNAAAIEIIKREPLFEKWSVNTLRARLLKTGMLPNFSRTWERCGADSPFRERGFFYGMNLQGDAERIAYQVLDVVFGQMKITREGTMPRREK